MGLDMYLYAKINAPKGSALCDIVEKHLTAEDRKQIGDPDFDNSAYISGWELGERKKPSALYVALKEATGFTPHEGSPHIMVRPDKAGGYIIEPVLFYWRKANAIHRWFVIEVQKGEDECNPHEVHSEQLMDLLERCDKVTADHSLAPSVLPAMDGFFFGGTDYDEWYFQDVKETAEELRAQVRSLLEANLGDVTMYYQSSW